MARGCAVAWHATLLALLGLSAAIRLEMELNSASSIADLEDSRALAAGGGEAAASKPLEPPEALKDWTDDFAEHVSNGQEVEEELTCAQLPGMMVRALTTGEQTLAGLCPGATSAEGACDNKTYGGEGDPIEVLLAVQAIVAGIMSEAEKRYCLVPVMTDFAVNLVVRDVLRFVPAMMRSGGSAAANERLEEGYRKLLAWQMAMVDQAEEMIDSTLLLPTDIEDPAHCPAPCKSCTRKRGLFRKDETFAFKCKLRRGDAAPTRPGLTCGKVKRRLFGWRRTWCEVEDWKAAACQQARVSALLTCGASSIMTAVMRDSSEDPIGEKWYNWCMEAEQGFSSQTNWELQYASHPDGVVEHWLGVSFSTILTVGVGSGLAAMREAAKGQKYVPGQNGFALVEEKEANTPLQILSAYKLGQEVEIDEDYRELYSSSNNTVDCERVAYMVEGCKDFFRTIAWRDLLGSLFVAMAMSAVIVIPVALSLHLFLYLLSVVEFAALGTGLAMGKVGVILHTFTSIGTMVGSGFFLWLFNVVTERSPTRCSIYHHDRRRLEDLEEEEN